MPVILDPADYAKWLGEDDAAPEELLGLLRPVSGRADEGIHNRTRRRKRQERLGKLD
jgi:hypothetical protein